MNPYFKKIMRYSSAFVVCLFVACSSEKQEVVDSNSLYKEAFLMGHYPQQAFLDGDIDRALELYYKWRSYIYETDNMYVNKAISLWQCDSDIARLHLLKGDVDEYRLYMDSAISELTKDQKLIEALRDAYGDDASLEELCNAHLDRWVRDHSKVYEKLIVNRPTGQP